MPISSAHDAQNSSHDGAYARYLPPHLRERYDEGLVDAEILHLKRQIALLDVRVKILLENLDRQVLTQERLAREISEEFPHLDEADCHALAKYLQAYLPETFIDTRTFRRLEQLAEKYEKAMADGSLIKAAEALAQLFAAIRAGRKDGEVWNEINEVMDNRRKLVEAEQRRVIQTQQMLSLDKAVRLIGVVIESLREAVIRYVPDRDSQQHILGVAERIYAERLIGAIDLPADAKRLD